MTSHNVSLGTVAYMSPEQASGNSNFSTTRSDIFSVGIIFFEAITHRLPIQAATHAEYLAILANQEVMSIRDFDRSVNVDLGAIIDKCLSLEPRYRYRDADELKSDLTRFIEGLPTKARPLSRGIRILRFFLRHRVASALSSMALLMLFTTTAFAVYYAIQSERNRILEGESAKRAFDAVIDGIKNSKTERLVSTLQELDSIKGDLKPRLAKVASAKGVGSAGFNAKFATLYFFGFSRQEFSEVIRDVDTLSTLEFRIFLTLCSKFLKESVEAEVRGLSENSLNGRIALISLFAGTGECGINSAMHDSFQVDRFQLIDSVANLSDEPEIAKLIIDRQLSHEVTACILTGIAEWPSLDDNALRASVLEYSSFRIPFVRHSARYAMGRHAIEVDSSDDINQMVLITLENGKEFEIQSTELSYGDIEGIVTRPEISEILTRFKGKRPGRGGLDRNMPVTGLSFPEIVQICNSLSEEAGFEQAYRKGVVDLTAGGFRLPTYEEWARATAGGAQTNFFFGDNLSELSKYAVISTSFQNETRILGSRSRRPNAFGIFDAFGNAAEVVHGDLSELLVVGGSSWANAEMCQPVKTTQFHQSVTIGIRLVRSLF